MAEEEIKNLKEAKKIHVITQNADTCVVYGMPKTAKQLGGISEELPLTQISEAVLRRC